PLEDLDPPVGPPFARRDLSLLATIRWQRAEDMVVMLGRYLAERDADVAGDPRLGVDELMRRAERLGLDLEAAAELAGMLEGASRVVGVVEEAKVHRLQQRLSPVAQLRFGVSDH